MPVTKNLVTTVKSINRLTIGVYYVTIWHARYFASDMHYVLLNSDYVYWNNLRGWKQCKQIKRQLQCSMDNCSMRVYIFCTYLLTY